MCTFHIGIRLHTSTIFIQLKQLLNGNIKFTLYCIFVHSHRLYESVAYPIHACLVALWFITSRLVHVIYNVITFDINY